MTKEKIRVLIVDDSAVVRQTLKEILETDNEISVIATASDPYIAANKIKKEIPDVITLDVEMPRMDGLTFLKKIMQHRPIPIIMVSSLTSEGSETAIKALEFGAVDVITKPQLGTKQFLEESKILLCDAVKSAARAKLRKSIPQKRVNVPPKLSADAVLSKGTSKISFQTTEKIIALGASTGGTESIRVFLEDMPFDSPGIVIVQHMPEHFTATFAQRLNTLSQMTVKEAQNGDSILRGHALIAPGNHHMIVKRSGTKYYVEVKQGPLVNRHRPSVDVLFRSVARYAGKNAVGVIMTGMGDDGARGMLEMKESGAQTIAQDEASCVVFGMPKEAIKTGGVDRVVSLPQISKNALELAGYLR